MQGECYKAVFETLDRQSGEPRPLPPLGSKRYMDDETTAMHCAVGRVARHHDLVLFCQVVQAKGIAVNIARSLDEERQQGRCRGLLHGVPIIVKSVQAYRQYEVGIGKPQLGS
jgi:Asp-tRNA(Asn)/Glu-tRNA(Gln) amidotransferase A subunit family amidase